MLIFIIFLIFVLFLAQKRSKKIGLTGIKYNYRLSKNAVEIDEQFEMVSTITNETRRFVPFIRLNETLPDQAKFPNDIQAMRNKPFVTTTNSYHSTIYLMARSKLKRKLKLKIDKRGWYVFNGATLHGGDYLGLSTMSKDFKSARTVTVYPEPVKSLHLQKIVGGFLGDISVRRFIMEDPVLTIGTREYTGREPMKQVSWKHTARTGQMMVKQFDYTTEMVVTLVLDVEQPKGKMFTDEQFEICYSLARTVAQYLDKTKIPFDFTTNALISGLSDVEKNSSRVSQNLGTAHLRFVLEKLGRASYGTKVSFDELVRKLQAGRKQQQNHSIIIISPERDANKERLTAQLQTACNSGLLIIYGTDFL